MSAATDIGTARQGGRLPWADVLLSAIAAVSWALIGMAGTAALGLHLLQADSAGSLGPMTAAVVALGAGGSVSPSGDVSAFGLKGAEAHTAIEITPLGVSLVGALLLSWFFLRSLRAAGVVIAPAELLARAGAVVVLFVATLGGLAWAGHDVITIDGGSLGLEDKLPGGGAGIPGLGDLGNVGGLLPDRIGDLVGAKAAVGFTVDTAPTLLGGLGWSTGILLIALLASRRTPLPRGWEAVHRVVRPAVSALVTVLLVAVVAGLAAAAYAAIGDDHPKRIAGAALLGAPNGVWLGLPIGLFVPWDGKATGALATLLPDPLDRLLSARADEPVTLSRLAELDGRVWLLAVAAAVTMLLAGVLTAVRTPVVGGGGHVVGRTPGGAKGGGDMGALGFAARCALRLGIATALTLPLLAWLTDVSVDASLSVLGFDAFGAGIELHGHLGMALLLGAAWGAGAGAAGALLAWVSGSAGWRAAPLARGVGETVASRGYVDKDYGGHSDHGSYGDAVSTRQPGPYSPGTPYRPPNPGTNPYLRLPDELRTPGGGPEASGGGPTAEGGRPVAGGRGPTAGGSGPATGGGGRIRGGSRGTERPYDGPGTPRPRPPYDNTPAPEEASPSGEPPPATDVHGAPTVARPIAPPPRSPGRGARDRLDPSDDGPPPPPPPPPPGRPEGRG
ncbi:streptophobe family protein [Streptomyces brasiliensis]|uniref:Integral membrane protein n=1 Tax=Streptomyces brasiliensis TaxID=1954 RepID=A0A917NX32_9ACTN|nr:streptophobe family protein [Streptomyces brasiliensis]GGJ37709.1 hypothetical protein GCM10010121_056120 [Streptomyces brasiliensis]